jgi:hypothetical protein
MVKNMREFIICKTPFIGHLRTTHVVLRSTYVAQRFTYVVLRQMYVVAEIAFLD